MSIVKQCRLLEIHRGGLYYKAKQESLENLKIMQLLDEQYFNAPFYGRRKLRFWLKNLGFKVHRNRVKLLIQIINWQTIYKEPKTTVNYKEYKKCPYLLKDLKITHKNLVWATDISYIPAANGFIYLTASIDLHTRFVWNWSVSTTMSADWCADNLQENIQKYGMNEIFDTDQGSQYTSEVHSNVLLNNEIKISMDAQGRAIDNIFIERFWRTVKYENVYLQVYTDGISLYRGLNHYLNFIIHGEFISH